MRGRMYWSSHGSRPSHSTSRPGEWDDADTGDDRDPGAVRLQVADLAGARDPLPRTPVRDPVLLEIGDRLGDAVGP